MTIQHDVIADPFIHEPKGASSANLGDVYVSDGAGSGTWTTMPTSIQTTPIAVYNDYTTQAPLVVDSPLQVTFGSGGVSAGGEMTMDNAGLLTINTAGYYRLSVLFHFARSGGNAGVAEVYGRFLVNGNQGSAVTVHVELDDSNTLIPVITDIEQSFEVGDTLSFEFLIDSAGVNAGELRTDTPALVGWNPPPAASITAYKFELV